MCAVLSTAGDWSNVRASLRVHGQAFPVTLLCIAAVGGSPPEPRRSLDSHTHRERQRRNNHRMPTTTSITQEEIASRALCNRLAKEASKMHTEGKQFSVSEDQLRKLLPIDLQRLRSYMKHELHNLSSRKVTRPAAPGPGFYNPKPVEGSPRGVRQFIADTDKFSDDHKQAKLAGPGPGNRIEFGHDARSTSLYSRTKPLPEHTSDRLPHLGPGRYNPYEHERHGQLPSIKFRHPPVENKDQGLPCPGWYEPNNTTIDSGELRKGTIIPMSRVKVEAPTPGPGAYVGTNPPPRQ